jgi:solute carrier family 25 folate transporter 32
MLKAEKMLSSNSPPATTPPSAVSANNPTAKGKGALPSLVAGALAGAVNTVVCCPLDVAKVRMQVQGSMGLKKYFGIVSSLRTIYGEEGTRGMFRGLGPALMTVPLFWGIYFYSYDYMKIALSDVEMLQNRTSLKHVCAAVCAGGIGDIISNPLWVLRTRIQTLALHQDANNVVFDSSSRRIRVKPVSMVELSKQIFRQEGFTAFYKGLSASFLGLSHVAVQFPLCKYDCLLALSITYCRRS